MNADRSAEENRQFGRPQHLVGGASEEQPRHPPSVRRHGDHIDTMTLREVDDRARDVLAHVDLSVDGHGELRAQVARDLDELALVSAWRAGEQEWLVHDQEIELGTRGSGAQRPGAFRRVLHARAARRRHAS